MGYKLDTEFIGKPHEWDPRRLYSQSGADWQYRVDFERLRKERLQKAREQMEVNDLGALVLFAGANIRYVTGSYQGNWKYNINIRYAVLPSGGESVLFETAGSDLQCARMDMPWMEDRIRPAMTWQWAEGAVPQMAGKMADSVVEVLEAHGVRNERIGITLYEGMWVSRAYSLDHPAEIKENMYFAVETFAGHPGLPQTCRMEENILVTADGPVLFTLMEHMEEAMK